MTNVHMQDQVHNRIEELMGEHDHNPNSLDWDEIFQNAATLALVVVFMTLGLSW